MKKAFLYILSAGLIASGCGKKSDGSGPEPEIPKPKQDIIQLQRIDFDNVYHKFEYNQDQLITRVESFRREANGLDMMYQYATYEYENGLPKRAAYHTQHDPTVPLYYTAKRFVYHYDAQKRIAFIAGTQTDDNNIQLWKDSTDLTFNNNNQLIKSNYRNSTMNSFNQLRWDYDAAGNVMRSGYTEPVDEWNTKIYSFDQVYDQTINPFRYNYLGLQMFVVFHEDIMPIEFKFSQNNSVRTKKTVTEERKNSRGEVVESKGESWIVSQTVKLDDNGSLASADVSAFTEKLEDGKVVSSNGGFVHTYKFTSVKKRH